MNSRSATRPAPIVGWALAVALLSAATGIAFAAWVDRGGQIFMAMIDGGLSWCF